ncbi:MAG: serine--tRNA ligase [Armatimonadota bacterium]|jgi:seryl-tRNA synthetase|nr:serine--tRNA ligase [Acidobacteriota bacterium]NLN88601.1 serine--tRNA ligase [candidate division WS1 bacterium]
MIDIRLFRQDPDVVRRGLANRSRSTDVVDRIIKLDVDRREIVTELDQLRATVNSASQEVGKRRRAGEDATALMEEVRASKERVKSLEEGLQGLESELQDALLTIPNLPAESVPVGADESANVTVRQFGVPQGNTPEMRAHWDVGDSLGVLDFDIAAKLAGARFNLMYREGARLERALMNFMLDLHVDQQGYAEVWPPYVAQRSIMQGTGQIPALEEDMWRCEDSDLYLIPTAEVPLTSLMAGEVIEEERLPLAFTAYTPCFRREAGAAGRDTRGLVRRHQFDKVELVWVTHPDRSFETLEQLTRDAEDVLKALGLPFRTIELCTGDLGTASTKTYDLEVWMPGMDRWLEISSCSNCTDFQARRADIRFRPADGGKPEFAHTLNGSGVAVGRCFAAILENFQQPDGTVELPEVLHGYMGGVTVLRPIEKRLL